MPSPPSTYEPEKQSVGQDPFKRLSLAVKELNRLINRAKQLAESTDQPIPRQQDSKASPQHTPPSVASDKK